MLAGEWTEDFKFPPTGSQPAYYRAGRWAAFTVKVSRRAVGTAQKPSVAFTAKKDGLKVGAVGQLNEKVKWGIAGKVEKLTPGDFIQALKTRQLSALASKCLGLEGVLGGSLSQNVSIGGGAEIALLPFIVKVEGVAAETILGAKGGLKVVVQVNFGPSSEGWIQIAQRTGQTLLNAWLHAARLGPLATKLASTGALAVAGIATATITASFGILAGTASYAGYVGKRGSDMGEATWYGSTYASIVRGLGPLVPAHYDPAVKRRQQELVNQAQSDVLQDARRHVANLRIALENPGDDVQVVQCYAGALSDKFGNVFEDKGNRALRDYVTDRAFEKIRAGEL
jgi:hypothetical protein